VAQAANQLSRTFASWNDFFGEEQFLGPPSIVTWAFRSSAPTNMPDDTAGFSRFNEMQINATLLALAAWSDVANIVFVRVGEGLVGEIVRLGRPLNLSDAPNHPAFAYRPETGEDPYHSFLGVPLLRGGRDRRQ